MSNPIYTKPNIGDTVYIDLLPDSRPFKAHIVSTNGWTAHAALDCSPDDDTFEFSTDTWRGVNTDARAYPSIEACHRGRESDSLRHLLITKLKRNIFELEQLIEVVKILEKTPSSTPCDGYNQLPD